VECLRGKYSSQNTDKTSRWNEEEESLSCQYYSQNEESYKCKEKAGSSKIKSADDTARKPSSQVLNQRQNMEVDQSKI
jgi:hypothetical protein